MALALPLTVIQVFDRVIPTQSNVTLAVLGMVILGAATAEMLLRGAASIVRSKSIAVREIDETVALAERTVMSRKHLVDATDPKQRIADFETIDRKRTLQSADGKASGLDNFFTVVFCIVFALIAPTLLWALLFIVALLLVPNLFEHLKQDPAPKLAEYSKRTTEFLTEAIQGAEETKGLRAEPWLERRFERLAHGKADLSGQATRKSRNNRARIEAIGGAIPALVGLAGCHAVLSGTLTVGGLAAAILLSGRAVQPLLKSQIARDAKRRMQAREDQLAAALSAPVYFGGSRKAPPLRSLTMRSGAICGEDGIPIFEGINFSIEASETLAVRGASGSGKSTLLRALSGRLLLDKGDLLWNGAPISEFSTASLSRRIVLLRQRPQLPNIPIYQYLTDFDDRRLKRAVKVADQLGITRALTAHPDGLSANIGDGSILPSLEARLPLARALAMDPDLLLFDEANLQLDAEADVRLRSCLEDQRFRSTIVLVSARPSYLALASQQVRLPDPRQKAAEDFQVAAEGAA